MEAVLSKDEVVKLADRCWRSPVEFCRVYLPAWFPTKMPWVHRGVAALRTGQTTFLTEFGVEQWPAGPAEWTREDLDKILTNFVIETKPAEIVDGIEVTPAETEPLFSYVDGVVTILRPDAKLNAYMLPRGFSKTTLLNAMNLRDICYQEAKFLVYVSETGAHAERQLSTVRGQLENNILLRMTFGDLVPDRSSSLKWTDSLIETTNGQRVGAIGRGGQLRGLAKDAQRPSRFVLDDLQDSEGVKSPTEREKDLDWLVRVVLPARKIFGDDQTVVDMVGTLLHPEALMAQIMDDDEWVRVRFGALDRQNDPLWAYAMDHEKLEATRKSFAKKGRLDAFDYEYMSKVPRNDGIAFPLHKLTYIHHEDDWFIGKALVCDPAISDNPKADFCAFAVMGIGAFGKLHLCDFYAEVGMEFAAQAEKFFELHFAHLAHLPPDQQKHGIESIAYQRSLISLITSKQHEKSQTWGNKAYFEVIPIKHGKTGKTVRVQGLLSPRVRAGHLSCEHHFPILEQQLKDWGEPGSKKDGPDVVAMAIALLDPFAALNANDDEDIGSNVVKLPPLKRALGGRSFQRAP